MAQEDTLRNNIVFKKAINPIKDVIVFTASLPEGTTLSIPLIKWVGFKVTNCVMKCFCIYAYLRCESAWEK